MLKGELSSEELVIGRPDIEGLQLGRVYEGRQGSVTDPVLGAHLRPRTHVFVIDILRKIAEWDGSEHGGQRAQVLVLYLEYLRDSPTDGVKSGVSCVYNVVRLT